VAVQVVSDPFHLRSLRYFGHADWCVSSIFASSKGLLYLLSLTSILSSNHFLGFLDKFSPVESPTMKLGPVSTSHELSDSTALGLLISWIKRLMVVLNALRSTPLWNPLRFSLTSYEWPRSELFLGTLRIVSRSIRLITRLELELLRVQDLLLRIQFGHYIFQFYVYLYLILLLLRHMRHLTDYKFILSSNLLPRLLGKQERSRLDRVLLL